MTIDDRSHRLPLLVGSVLLMLLVLCCGGCGGGRSGPDTPDVETMPGDSTTGASDDVLASVALWGTWAGGVLVLLGIVATIWWSRSKGIMLVATGIGITVGARILAWVADHLWWIAPVVAVSCIALGAVWVWRHKLPVIERFFRYDINRDGWIGRRQKGEADGQSR